ncbi:MAG: hypothetical protein JWR38_5327 [Mucilaginibacter sp.]|nr:hypothetical protein [Mucilaginibacter sp.]
MNRLVNKWGTFTILPPKYKVLYTVDTIGNNTIDKYIDTERRLKFVGG